MEIFKILGKVAIDNESANDAIDETTSKAKHSEPKISEAFKKIGTAVVTYFAVDKIIDFGKKIVGMVDEVQGAVNNFAAATGLAGDELSGFENAMQNIYKNNFGESYEDIAEAMSLVKQQAGDIGAEELEKMTTDALILRDTFGYEVGESMRSAKMLMDQFGLSSEEAFNLIAIGAQEGLDKNGDLLDTINEYSVHYKQLEYSADDMLRSLKGGAEAGIFSVDKMGDAVKEFGIRVKDGSDTTVAALEYLGYDAQKVMETISRGGAEAAGFAQLLMEEMAGMPDSVEKTTHGVALFGTMWEDVGAEGIGALAGWQTELDTTRDAMSQINAVKYDTLGAALEGLKRTVETSVLQPLGEKLLPLVEKAVEFIQKNVAPAVQFVSDKFQGLYDKASVYFPAIQQAFEAIWKAAKTIWETVGQPIFNTISSAVDTVRGVFVERMPEIKKFVSDCFSDISAFWNNHLKPCFEAIGNFIENVLAPVFKAVFETRIKGMIDNVFRTIKSLWNDTLKPVFVGITDFLTGVFTGNWKQAWEGIKSILTGILNGIINGIEFMINGAINCINGLINGINKLISKAGELLGLNIAIPTIPTLNLPRLEEGGVLEAGQVGLLEGNGAEAVVPLERNKAWISAVARDMQDVGIGGSDALILYMKQLVAMLSEFFPQLLEAAGHDIVTDDGAILARYAPLMNFELGRISNRKDRGR